jgi:hypothetical protein
MLRENLKTLFDLYGEKMVAELKQRMQDDETYATGDSANSLEYRSADTALGIFGFKRIKAISFGVPGASYEDGEDNAPSPRAIQKWIDSKGGITARKGRQDKLAFAISKYIQKNGIIKRYQSRGGGSGLLDFVLNNNIEQLTADVAQEALNEIGQSIDLKAELSKDIIIR